VLDIDNDECDREGGGGWGGMRRGALGAERGEGCSCCC